MFSNATVCLPVSLLLSPIPSQTLTLPDGGYADKLAWTQGGNVLSVSTKQGALHSCAASHPFDLRDIEETPLVSLSCSSLCVASHVLSDVYSSRYLMKVPCLCAGWDTKVAFLASLRELCVTDSTGNAPTDVKIALESEPAFGKVCATFYTCSRQRSSLPCCSDRTVAVGPKCVACGMNNRVWYYSTETRQLINDKEYHGAPDPPTIMSVRDTIVSRSGADTDFRCFGCRHGFTGRAQR